MIETLTALFNRIKLFSSLNFEFGKSLHNAAPGSLIFFPYQPVTLNCGISALVAFKPADPDQVLTLDRINEMIDHAASHPLNGNLKKNMDSFLGGTDLLGQLFDECQALKTEHLFATLYFDKNLRQGLKDAANKIDLLIKNQKTAFKNISATLSSKQVDTISSLIEKLQDIGWCLTKEIIDNIDAIDRLAINLDTQGHPKGLVIFKRINAVLNSIDRLEVRGRDSAGISVIFTFTKDEFEKFRKIQDKNYI